MSAPADTVTVDRPNPLRGAALAASTGWGALSGVVGAAVSFGALTAAQAEAITAFGTALPGWLMAAGVIAGAIIPAVSSVIASFTTARIGRDGVTPVGDPRDNNGTRLVPITPAGASAPSDPAFQTKP